MTAKVILGPGADVDPTAILGYVSGRTKEVLPLEIGPGAVIRSHAVIYSNTRIGSELQTGHNVVIREENLIGDRLSIWNNSTIDYGCVIGSGVKIHNNVYVAQFTVIEDDVFLGPGVMIANDPHPTCGKCMRGPTIQRGARIGVNATILPRVVIGEGSLIGAGAVVVSDVPPKSVVVGNPGCVVKQIADLRCRFGTKDRPYD